MDRPYALAPHEKNEWSGASRIMVLVPISARNRWTDLMQSLFKRTSADEVQMAEGLLQMDLPNF